MSTSTFTETCDSALLLPFLIVFRFDSVHSSLVSHAVIYRLHIGITISLSYSLVNSGILTHYRQADYTDLI